MHLKSNYLEAFFVFTQVQVIQQNCSVNIGASCTCAVAVRTGDDVFKVDRCRVEGSDDVPPTIAVMYLNGELNPGTRIFSKESGNKFEVFIFAFIRHSQSDGLIILIP